MMYLPTAQEAVGLAMAHQQRLERVQELLRHIGKMIHNAAADRGEREVTLRVHDVAPRYSWEAAYILNALEQMKFVCEWSEDESHLCIRWPEEGVGDKGQGTSEHGGAGEVQFLCVAWPAVVVVAFAEYGTWGYVLFAVCFMLWVILTVLRMHGMKRRAEEKREKGEWKSGCPDRPAKFLCVVWPAVVVAMSRVEFWGSVITCAAGLLVFAWLVSRAFEDLGEWLADWGNGASGHGAPAAVRVPTQQHPTGGARLWTEVDFQMVLTRAVLDAQMAWDAGKRARADLWKVCEDFHMPLELRGRFVIWLTGREVETARGRRRVRFESDETHSWIVFGMPLVTSGYGFDWERGVWGVAEEEGEKGRRGDAESSARGLPAVGAGVPPILGPDVMRAVPGTFWKETIPLNEEAWPARCGSQPRIISGLAIDGVPPPG